MAQDYLSLYQRSIHAAKNQSIEQGSYRIMEQLPRSATIDDAQIEAAA
jgi:hypothetical protein